METPKSPIKRRIHLVALPHTQVSPEFVGCAYTSKVLKFCKMMGESCEIHLYAPEGPTVPGAAHQYPIMTNGRRIKIFGDDDPNRLPAWPTEEQSKEFNTTVAAVLKKQAEPHDLVLLTGGRTHKPIADALPKLRCIEPGVGYEGIFTGFCAFESVAWRHTVYAKAGINDGRWFDTVIPNYFDKHDFTDINTGAPGEHLLFLGRLIHRKGLHVAADIAKACGRKLVVAGAGGKMKNGKLIGNGVEIEGDIEYVGPVGIKARSQLLAGARALMVPTTYLEPFGGVVVEANMCGTPVITTDWGAFTEIVTQGRNGYRFSTLSEGVNAVKNLDRLLPPGQIRHEAWQRFSLERVAPLFERWFAKLDTLWHKGWYQIPAHEFQESLSTSIGNDSAKRG